jgi:hypothetical protein
MSQARSSDGRTKASSTKKPKRSLDPDVQLVLASMDPMSKRTRYERPSERSCIPVVTADEVAAIDGTQPSPPTTPKIEDVFGAIDQDENTGTLPPSTSEEENDSASDVIDTPLHKHRQSSLVGHEDSETTRDFLFPDDVISLRKHWQFSLVCHEDSESTRHFLIPVDAISASLKEVIITISRKCSEDGLVPNDTLDAIYAIFTEYAPTRKDWKRRPASVRAEIERLCPDFPIGKKLTPMGRYLYNGSFCNHYIEFSTYFTYI